jgi:heat shock protein HslJ
MSSKSSNSKNNKWVIFSVLGVLLLVVIIFAACSSNTPTPVVPTAVPPVSTNTPAPAPILVDVNQLYANPWVLVGYGNPDNPSVIAEGVAITLEFTADGQLSGFSGCNNYSGSYQAATDGTLTISPLATTLMACAQGMDLETTYLTALQSARSFRFNSQGRLSIVYSDPSQPEQLLIFASSAKPLTNTNWVLVSYGDPASPTAVPVGTVITAVFTPDGYVSGYSGCNQYSASYSLNGQQITIGTVAMTQMACSTGMEVEQNYLSSLGTAQEYAISGQQLTVTYNQNAGVLTYTAANVPLEYSLWTLTTMNGQPIPAETSITATFTPGETPNAGTVGGSSGCNTYNAAYTLDGSNITVEAPAMTMMACETGMDTEQAYLQALQVSESYQIFGDKLVVTNPSGNLTYTVNRTPLAGALWILVSIGDVNNPQPPVAGSKFAAQFSRIPGSPSGVLTGTTGCNEYTAAFAATVDEIKINLPVSTMNTSCVPGLSDQEQLYFLALNDAATYRISGNTLVIPYDGGKQELVYEGTQLESAERPTLSALNGTTWFLWYMNNTPIVPGTSIYGQFTVDQDGASGTLSGSAGCNSYVATFGQDLGVQATLNAHQVCSQPAGIMEQEGAYINMLSRAFGYWQTGAQLIINTGQGVLTYRSSEPSVSADQTYLLVGKTWYFVSYNSTYSLAGTQEPYTLFQTDGTLTGYSGCNSFQGTYTTNIQAITISNLNSTLSACPSAALTAQEQAIFAILGSAKSYQVADTVMQLVGDQGVLNYSLTPINRPEEILPPQAVINAPAEAQTGQVVRFDGSASNGQVPVVSWEWDFGDGWTGTGSVVDHVYTSPATHNIVLTVTDQRGYQGTQKQSITITTPEVPTVTPTPPPQPTATAVPTQPPQPSPTVAPTQPSQPTPTAGATQPPAPTATVEATQPPQPTATIEPTQPPQPTPTVEPTQPPQVPPQAVIQGSSQGYVGEPIVFDASASVSGSSPIVSYSWNFGDGTSTEPSPNPSQTTIYNQSGSFQVSVVVTDESGQSSSATMEVTISTRLNTPVVWVLDSYANLEVLPGTGITLQFQAGQIAGFSGCNTYTGAYTATDNGDGTYSVTVTGLVGTGMMCPAEIMDQEQTYLGILSQITIAQGQGNVLTLSSPQSNLIFHQSGN